MKRHNPYDDHGDATKPRAKYSVQVCADMDAATDAFVNEICSLGGTYSIVDHVRKRTLVVPNSLTIDQLERSFGRVGHGLAVDLSVMPAVLFGVDVDCTMCKRDEAHTPLDSSFKHTIVQSMCQVLARHKLPTGYVLMERANHCGWHVYWTFHVSVVVYHWLLSELATVEKPARIVVDLVTTVPLPFSSKQDYEQYQVIDRTVDLNFGIVPRSWFDFNYEVSADGLELSSTKLLLGFYESSLQTGLENWAPAVSKSRILIADKKLVCQTVNQLARLKLVDHRFISADHPILEAHLNVKEQTAANFVPVDLCSALVELSSIVATNHYGFPDPCPGFSLHKFLLEKDSRYAFYVLAALHFHLQNVDPETNSWAQLTKLCAASPNLLTLATRMQAAEAKMNRLIEIFNCGKDCYPIVWIKCVSDQVKLEQLTCHDVDMCVHFLQTKYPVMFFNDVNDLSYYRDGLYQKTKNPSHEVTLSKEIFKLHENCSAAGKFLDFKQTVLTKWQPRASMFRSNADANVYEFFINVADGVWNTITHTLMEPIPMLYFTTRGTMRPVGFEKFNVPQFLAQQHRSWVTNVLMKGLYEGAHNFSNENLNQVWQQCCQLVRTNECEDLYQQIEKDFGLDPCLVVANTSLLQAHFRNSFEDLLAKVDPQLNEYEHEFYALSVVFTTLAGFHKQNNGVAVLAPTVPEFLLDDRSSFIETTFSQMFNFDAAAIEEFLLTLTSMFTPHKERSKVTLLVGCGRAGKSTITKLLLRMWNKSSFSSVASFVAGEAGKPSPATMAVYNKYLVVLNEVAKVDAVFLKSLTGDDTSDQRTLYEGTMSKQRGCSFIVGVCNSVPTLSTVDEAVYMRLAPFQFPKQFMTRAQCLRTTSTTNPLVLYTMNIICSNVKPDTEAHAQEFLDLVYAAFVQLNRSSMDLPLQNRNSRRVLEDLMCKNVHDLNSKVYRSMRAHRIVRSPHLTIGVQELMDVLQEDQLPISERELRVLFSNEIVGDNGPTIKGFGYRKELGRATPLKFFVRYPRAEIENQHPTFMNEQRENTWIDRGHYVVLPACFNKPPVYI